MKKVTQGKLHQNLLWKVSGYKVLCRRSSLLVYQVQMIAISSPCDSICVGRSILLYSDTLCSLSHISSSYIAKRLGWKTCQASFSILRCCRPQHWHLGITWLARPFRRTPPTYVLHARIPRKLSPQSKTTLSRTSALVSAFLFKVLFGCGYSQARGIRSGLDQDPSCRIRCGRVQTSRLLGVVPIKSSANTLLDGSFSRIRGSYLNSPATCFHADHPEPLGKTVTHFVTSVESSINDCFSIVAWQRCHLLCDLKKTSLIGPRCCCKIAHWTRPKSHNNEIQMFVSRDVSATQDSKCFYEAVKPFTYNREKSTRSLLNIEVSLSCFDHFQEATRDICVVKDVT